jgi:MbtH protein
MSVQSNEEDGAIYQVVVNHEEQYSIWPADKTIPHGWNEAGKKGTKAECLEHVNAVWIDMRPLSLQQQSKSKVKSLA